MRWLIKKLDNLIYFFVGPFGALYAFPQMCLQWDRKLGIELPQYDWLDALGRLFMQLGGVLAIWCAVLMFMHRRGSASPLQQPTSIVSSGPYGWVRHPMMWTINLVLIGQVLTYSSPLIAVWLVIWCRFAVLYIARYEEPYLLNQLPDEYAAYCRKTPRWFPFAQPHLPDSSLQLS